MSRQRKIHPSLVAVEKRGKVSNKVFSECEKFQEFVERYMRYFGLPPYRGTKYRGTRRWLANAGN